MAQRIILILLILSLLGFFINRAGITQLIWLTETFKEDPEISLWFTAEVFEMIKMLFFFIMTIVWAVTLYVLKKT